MPSKFRFEPRSPRYGPCLVSGCWCTLRRFWGFLAPFWAIFSDISWSVQELNGTRGLFDTAKSSRMWVVAAVSLQWEFCPGLGAILGEKWLFLAQNCADLGGHLPTWRHRPGPPLVSFQLKTWIWQGHHLGSKMATWAKDPKRWDGAMAKTAWRRVVACCLLAKFKGRGV